MAIKARTNPWVRRTLIGLALAAVIQPAFGARPAPPPGVRVVEHEESQPNIERIDEHRVRIGSIQVDRQARRLELPGEVIRLQPPLEFLAVKRNGYKAYESLLELDTTATDLNTALILIGLTGDKATHPEHQSEEKPVEGPRVAIRVRWEADGGPRETEASRLLLVGGQPVDAAEWVYTGSAFLPDGRYLAALDGTLIGFTHDPASIIEHRTGLALRHYGAVAGNPELCPPPGTRVVVTVQVEG